MRRLPWSFTVSLLLACSSSSTPTGPVSDGGADALVVDADAPDTADAAPPRHYPAFTPAMPQIVNNKGGVLTSPKIVTVTWSVDPHEAVYQAFDDAIGTSEFWKATTAEYGVGPGQSGGHVSIQTAPPSTLQSSDLDTWVATQVAGAPANGWPVNDANTLYLLYLPTQMKLTLGGNTMCLSGVGGFHTETSINGMDITYGVIGLECAAGVGQGVTQFGTSVGSHEIVEAVTDPHVQTTPGFVGYDAPHWAWANLLQYANETGDACEFFPDSNISATSPPYDVQRCWSNAAAAAGHNPCQGPVTDPYFNVTPLDTVDITLKDQGRKVVAKGYPMKVGVASSFNFGFYSDGPTSAWTVDAVEGSPFGAAGSPTLTIALQGQTGKDGDIGTAYVTPNFVSPPQGTLVTLVAHNQTSKRYMPVLIQVTK